MAKNIDIDLQGNILTIQIDLTKSFGLTGSGKSSLIATTGGTILVGRGRSERINITVHRPMPK